MDTMIRMILALAFMACLGLAAPQARAGHPITPQTPKDTVVARGQQVYQEQRCAACHSIGGKGNSRYPLDGVGSRLSREQLRKWVVSPRDMNPAVRKRAYTGIPRADLEALVSYLASLTSTGRGP